jgi:hypothetical protein
MAADSQPGRPSGEFAQAIQTAVLQKGLILFAAVRQLGPHQQEAA